MANKHAFRWYGGTLMPNDLCSACGKGRRADCHMDVVLDHTCEEPTACTCSRSADSPTDECPQHGAGYLPHCKHCKRFMPLKPVTITSEFVTVALERWRNGEKIASRNVREAMIDRLLAENDRLKRELARFLGNA